MSDNYYDQFEKWKNDDKEKNPGQTPEENTISDVYEEAEESQGNNTTVEQVSRDLFGFTQIHEQSEEQDEPDDEINNNDQHKGGTQKTSFAELRQGKKVPRLKKTMVLGIIVGGTFLFLFVINLFLQKNDDEKQYFDMQRNIVAAGNDFYISDLLKSPLPTNDENVHVTENPEYYLRTPPSYDSPPAYRPSSSGGNTVSATAHSVTGYYSDSDLLAIRAQIGKEGGYGFMAQAAVYYPRESTENLYIQPEEYTRQRIEEIARLAQATNGEERSNVDRINNGRYSDAGNYNPNNTQAGSGLGYLNDNCLFPGTIIHAILVSRIDTDYPGPIHARVTENIYDSKTGKNLLIPQGTILQGSYSSSAIGVAKVQIAWESMVVNYGGIAYQISLGGMAGVDKRGRAGIAGTLDDHYFEWLKAAGIVSLFSIFNSEVAYQTQGQRSPQIRELMDINQGIANNLGARLMERAMNIQPTVRVANGTAVSVSVNAPLTLRPFPAIKAEEKYVRR
jgi:type IV secretion system protein VirB10